jgi:hypothetical protein
MPKTIILDANLIVLLVVGLAGTEYIAKHKRLKTYLIEDYEILKTTIEQSAGVVVTPNALSEASNLLRQIADPAREKISLAFKNLIQNTNEKYLPSKEACDRGEFIRFGLSDNALLEVGKTDIVLVSVDANLCIAAQNAGYEAVNFNHLRNL